MFDFFNVWESAANIISYDPNNGNMSITGTARDFFTSDTLMYGAVFTALIDDSGSHQIKELFARDSVRYYTHIGLHINNLMMLKSNDLRTFTGTNRNINNILIYFDKYGDSIVSFQTMPNQDKFDAIQMTRNVDKLYLWGRDITISSSTTAPFALLCIDTTGKQLWYKIYWGKRRYANSVVTDDEGNFLVAGTSYKGDGGLFDTISGWYAKIDTAGNFIWERFLDKGTANYKTYVWLSKSENGYYLTGGNDGSYYASAVIDTSFAYMMQFNPQNGNINWDKRFFNSSYALDCGLGKMEYHNGHFYGMIDYETTEGWNNYSQYIAFVKTDTSGNLKWKRLFSQWYKDNRAFSLTAVPDGFIICADGKDTTHTTGFTDAWIIKTDTNGCIVPGCHLTDGLVQITNPDAFVNVFPNPASDNITVQITDSRAKLKSYFLYDGKGNFITQQALTTTPDKFDINTQQLTPGNYYLVLELEQGQRATKKILIQR